MQPKVWGTWPGELVKQYGRFRLHKTIITLPPGVMTKNRSLIIFVENRDKEPVRIRSLDSHRGDVTELIAHVRRWLDGQRRRIERVQSIMSTREEGKQLEFERTMVMELEERYQIVEEALKELGASLEQQE
jgi:hypothetical protein